MSRALNRQLRTLQRRLERFYGLERAPRVENFLRLSASRSREQVLVQQSQEGVLLAVIFPEDQIPTEPLEPSDNWAQLIEAVSHFLFLAERARVELSTTRLELELQAEIDKFVILSATTGAARIALDDLHRRLYDDVRFLDASETEQGARYRLANHLAARFLSRLLQSGHVADWRKRLRAFYRAGPTEKISIAMAA
jgi:hypothetical protein